MRKCNEMIGRTLQLTDLMVEIADLGEEAREDVGCGVLYGLLRDSAYKIRKMAEEEKKAHVRKGWWLEEKQSKAASAASSLQDLAKKVRT